MLCIVSHDAGGAEILSSYVRRERPACNLVLGGPAQKIFERKLGPVELMPLEEAVERSESLLCGTSWQSDIEWQAIDLARRLGKKAAAFLDHWVNYWERFVRNGETHLPDEIWVGDPLASAMATDLFPQLRIVLVDNPYFQDLREEVRGHVRTDGTARGSLRVLYVCEPLREHALREFGDERHWGYTEEDALRYFLANLQVLGMPVEQIVLRPHPSELARKVRLERPRISLADRSWGRQVADRGSGGGRRGGRLRKHGDGGRALGWPARHQLHPAGRTAMQSAAKRDLVPAGARRAQ